MDERAFERQSLAGEAIPIRRSCDPRQIAHFNSQAETGAGDSARRWLYRYNPLRLAFAEAMVVRAGIAPPNRPLRGLRLLDVGCGTGVFCEALAMAGATVRGIDPAMATVALARRQAPPDVDLHYANGVVEDEATRYDIVTAMEVIEHVPDAPAFLRDCAARVRPGGILVLSTINRTWQSYIYAILVAERLLGLLPRGAHEWRRFVRPGEIEKALRPEGFRMLACWGATMNLSSRMMQRARGRGVNYLIALQRTK
jgi:2-polyprenyl-6-hydroxyphenyl methylase/3-demethylubiquinone-9 3-methyltransferase